MNIPVDNNWWKNLFDEVYLQTDARTVCNDQLTLQEVNFLEDVMNLRKSAAILDLCGGQGRHALEFSRRGFTHITVVDYSEFLIGLGKKRAHEEKLNTIFVQGDARDTGLPPESFAGIIIMASSFGYFPEEAENQKILVESFRLLEPGGIFLLDLPNRDYVLQNFRPFSAHKIDEDLTVNRTRKLGDEIIYSRETVVSQREGPMRDRTYCIRLYSREKISDMVSAAGFSALSFSKDFMSRESEGDYGCMTNRMIVMAKKI